MNRYKVLATSLLLLGLVVTSLPSWSWWDTRIKAQRDIPLVREFSAASLIGIPQNAVRKDTQANGGQGGQVVVLTPQSNIKLQVQMELPRSIYALWAIARTEQEFDKNKRPEAYFTLDVTQPDGAKKSWTMPVTYLNSYEAIARIYFPAHVTGKYSLSMSLDAKSEVSFLVDRLELRDALGNTARKAAKTKRMLTNDAELQRIREDAAKKTEPRFNTYPYRDLELPVAWPTSQNFASRSPQERRAAAEKIWAALPNFNVDTNNNSSADPYQWLLGHDRPGLFVDGARIFQEYNDREIAWDAAILMAGLAERYPALNTIVQGVTPGQHQFRTNPDPFGFSIGPGKFVYSGWAAMKFEVLARAYDQIFDFIKDNQELADFLHTKIPWIKTPRDVIELVDTNLLQHGIDSYNRRHFQGNDKDMALVPLVQGVNDVSRDMLEQNLWSRVDLNMADAGGIDDQIFTAYSRDGVRYIGSVLYIGNELIEIAELLHRYVQEGGDPKYDLLDPKRYPHLSRAQYTIEATTVAGGFPLVIGDARDLHVGRINDKLAQHPSRVLGGFGVAILEDGQSKESPTMKRAVAVRTGTGVGHAQQDTLNLDITALGTRLAPDLGGREEGPNRGRPNMRWNRVHNLVEVDDKNFENIVPGSTTSGTGWTRLFSSVPGAQVMINAGRATSHPQVSLYERTTAMIDGPVQNDLAPIYVFDVFRVAGGKTHTFNFHGAESDDFQINTEMKPAASKAAVRYLDKHKEGTKQEGQAPAVLEATWRLKAETQKSWLGDVPENARRHSRLTLFNHQGDDVFIGNAWSDRYNYDFPFLSVQKRGAEGMQSTYISLVEAFAGEPFIASKRQLNVAGNENDARSAAAVEVLLKNGRRDVVFADGQPDKTRVIEGGITAAGEFAFYSEDAQGLRQMHLAGGTQLQKGNIGIVAAQAKYSGEITAVNYADRAFLTNAAVPVETVKDQVTLTGNAQHWTEFNLAAAQPMPKTGVQNSTRVQMTETPQFYQSKLLQVDTKTNSIVCELDPSAVRSDPKFFEGATASNEAGDKFWKVHIEADERWMHLGWPGYRTSWPNTIKLSEIPDANGDGKRTLKMLASPQQGDAGGGELVMEVTRVDENENTFYFKMPQDARYQQGGWQFNFRTLVNEDGSKTWRSLYAGTGYRFVLSGPPVNEAAFTDTDKDGKRKLKIYHFGPGDTFMLPTHAAVSRIAPNEYEVRSNVACTLMLPGKGQVEIEVGGKSSLLPTEQKNGVVTVRIEQKMISSQPLRVRLNR